MDEVSVENSHKSTLIHQPSKRTPKKDGIESRPHQASSHPKKMFGQQEMHEGAINGIDSKQATTPLNSVSSDKVFLSKNI